jgi:alkylation response protein AidB-like acyl-CoA dehydrogenase
VTVRPLRQMTGAGEFNEVFFDDARTPADMVVGEVNGGWKVAMATLGFERGTAFMAMQLAFEREWHTIAELARKNGVADDPVMRQRLAQAWVGVKIMGYNGMRMQTALAQSGTVGPEASIGKLYWSTWHRNLGELAMDILGPAGQIVPLAGNGEYALDDVQRSYMFARSETIYAGSSEIQRNIIGERVLGLPREPR